MREKAKLKLYITESTPSVLCLRMLEEEGFTAGKSISRLHEKWRLSSVNVNLCPNRTESDIVAQITGDFLQWIADRAKNADGWTPEEGETVIAWDDNPEYAKQRVYVFTTKYGHHHCVGGNKADDYRNGLSVTLVPWKHISPLEAQVKYTREGLFHTWEVEG
jgi:hypothetical protein